MDSNYSTTDSGGYVLESRITGRTFYPPRENPVSLYVDRSDEGGSVKGV